MFRNALEVTLINIDEQRGIGIENEVIDFSNIVRYTSLGIYDNVVRMIFIDIMEQVCSWISKND